jgi:hypothetical protein
MARQSSPSPAREEVRRVVQTLIDRSTPVRAFGGSQA